MTKNVGVEYLQARLNQYGAGLLVDGLWGSRTQLALDAALPAKATQQVARSLKNPAAFFQGAKAVTGTLTQSQVDGTNYLLDAMKAWPVSWVAYGLATAFHETAHTMQPIKEMGGNAYFKKRYDIEGDKPDLAKRLGNINAGDGVKYAGRGYVQITGRSNYERFGIADNPDLALDPSVASKIMVQGMEKGVFTGKKNADYLPGDYVGARRIINGQDAAHKIAGYARSFEDALTAGGWS